MNDRELCAACNIGPVIGGYIDEEGGGQPIPLCAACFPPHEAVKLTTTPRGRRMFLALMTLWILALEEAGESPSEAMNLFADGVSALATTGPFRFAVGVSLAREARRRYGSPGLRARAK